MKLLFGTYNPKKAEEVRAMLGPGFELLTCADFPNLPEAVEDGPTLEANALIKARYYHEKTGLPCFADDTGLEVDALGGAPGVDTAHFAGFKASPGDNMQKLLESLQGKASRKARFRTVFVYMEAVSEPRFFTGELRGEIARLPAGANGFGYDPVFIPEGGARTLAEYSAAEKNAVSHRGQALAQLTAWLKAKA